MSWLAIRGKTKSAIHDELGLVSTNEYEEIPEYPICGAALPSDWYLVVYNDEFFDDDRKLARLSHDSEIVRTFIEEHCMTSSTELWLNGKTTWSIIHEASEGIEHLEVSGTPPADFSDIRDSLFAKQNQHSEKDSWDVDYIFNVPVDMARSITGFCHDECLPELEGVRFECLQRKKQKKRWWPF